MKYLLILVLSISQCFAIDVTPVKKGDLAPKDGFFIDQPNMKEMRKNNEERKILKKQNVKLKDLAVINEERIDIYRKRSQEAEKARQHEQNKGFWKGVGGFVLGTLATGAAAYVAIRATK